MGSSYIRSYTVIPSSRVHRILPSSPLHTFALSFVDTGEMLLLRILISYLSLFSLYENTRHTVK
jgi:hypothetical protein